MRVEDRLAADASRQSAATAETQKSRQVSPDAGGAPSPGSDRLQLSALAGRIRGALDDMANAHAARVADVAGQVRAGRYQVDTAALGRVLASEAFGG